MSFCTDLDLLRWEPNIFRDAAFASQTLLAGTGDLAAATFTIAAGSFTEAHVASAQVIVLSGGTLGSYPILEVNSATQLTISVLYDALFPLSELAAPSPVGTATGLNFAIRTFSPQAQMVGEMLKQSAGIMPGTAEEESVAILNPQALRRSCVLGTLQMIYSALAANIVGAGDYRIRADVYERLYRQALRCARVELDLDGDGEMDVRRDLNVLQLLRV